MSSTNNIRHLATEVMLDFNTVSASLHSSLPAAGNALSQLGVRVQCLLNKHFASIVAEVMAGQSSEALAINHVRRLEEKPALDFSYQGLLSPGWDSIYLDSPEGKAAQQRLRRVKSYMRQYVNSGDAEAVDRVTIKQRDFETTIDFDSWNLDMTVRSLLAGLEFTLPAEKYLPVQLIEERYRELESRFHYKPFVFSETEEEVSQRLCAAEGLLPVVDEQAAYFDEYLVWITPNQTRVSFLFENFGISGKPRLWRVALMNGRSATFEGNEYLINHMLADLERIVFGRKIADDCVDALPDVGAEEVPTRVPVDTLLAVLGERKEKVLIRLQHPSAEELGIELTFAWDPTTKKVDFADCRWHGARWDNVIEKMEYFPSHMKFSDKIPAKLRKHLYLLFTMGTFEPYKDPASDEVLTRLTLA